MNEKRFWEIVGEYPEKTKGYEIGRFGPDVRGVDKYSFNDGVVTFSFNDEAQLRKILEEFDALY